MFCPSCGMKVGEQDRFCSICGKSLIDEQETELFSFGPCGVSVCFSRPGFFVWTQRNSTKIVLTDQRIVGSSMFSNTLRFQIPYKTILSSECFTFNLWKVLWIQFQDGETVREVSIMCTPFTSYHITKAMDLLQKARKWFDLEIILVHTTEYWLHTTIARAKRKNVLYNTAVLWVFFIFTALLRWSPVVWLANLGWLWQC